jgi:hypothetical protein
MRTALLASPLLLVAGVAHSQTATPTPLPAPVMASQLPIPLFQAVCINGTAKLSRKWASASNYAAIPADGQAAIGQSVMGVPNPVYQIGGGNEYLILPSTTSAMPFATSCAVVWQGDDLAAAKKVPPPPADVQLVVTASLVKGWTVLKSVPAPGAAVSPPAGVQ